MRGINYICLCIIISIFIIMIPIGGYLIYSLVDRPSDRIGYNKMNVSNFKNMSNDLYTPESIHNISSITIDQVIDTEYTTEPISIVEVSYEGNIYDNQTEDEIYSGENIIGGLFHETNNNKIKKVPILNEENEYEESANVTDYHLDIDTPTITPIEIDYPTEINDIKEFENRLIKSHIESEKNDEFREYEINFIKSNINKYYEDYKKRPIITDYDTKKKIELFLDKKIGAEELFDTENMVLNQLESFIPVMEDRIDIFLLERKNSFNGIYMDDELSEPRVMDKVINLIRNVGVSITPNGYVNFKILSLSKLEVFYPKIYEIYLRIILGKAHIKVKKFVQSLRND